MGLSKRLSLLLILALFFGVDHSVFGQPACVTNPIAGDFCNTATPICNLNGYCGNTSASYTNWVSATNHANETNTPLGSVFCATIQNNSWLKFIASATSAVFDVWVSNCANNHGIQMQIYSTTDCYNFTAVSNCWNPMSPTNGQITATGLIPGQVYYFMIDGTNGDICDYVIAANSGVVAPGISPGQSVCSGTTVSITASGGSGYLWTSNPPDPSLIGQTTNAVIHVSPSVTTVYSATITIPGSNTFCPITTNVLTSQVTIYPLPAIHLAFTPDHCGLSDGSATVIVNGDSTDYNYLWSTTPTQQTTATINGLSFGLYSVTVSDSNNCSVVDSVQIIESNQLYPFITGPSGFCQGNSIQLDAGSGFTGYLWSNNLSTQTININQGGTYSVTVTRGLACNGSDTVTVKEFQDPHPQITGPSWVCAGVTSVLNAGNDYMSYQWSTGAVTQTISIIEGGLFSVSVTDSNNCSGFDDIHLQESIPPQLTVSSEVEVCHQSNGSASVEVSPAGASYTFLWNTGDSTQNITGLSEGNYSVSVSDSSCTSQATVAVGESPGPQALFVCHPYAQTLLDEFDPVTFYFIDQSTGNISTWQWDFGDSTSGSSQNPSHQYNQLGIYYITLTVADSSGCFNSYADSIEVRDVFTFYIPNAFSPDGDGVNEMFAPKGNHVDPDHFVMYIYDAWGKLVFSTTHWNSTQSEAWNGTYNNKGSAKDAEVGVYVYRIFAKEIEGIEHNYKGIIALVR